MEKLETYLNKHPEVAKLIDLSFTEFGAYRPDKKEAYYLVVNAVPLTLELDYQPTGTGSTEFVVSLEAPKELLEEAREKARGHLRPRSWYPLHPALKVWAEARIQAWERDYPRLYDLADMLIAEVLTRLLPALMEDQKKTREILAEIRDLLKNHTA